MTRRDTAPARRRWQLGRSRRGRGAIAAAALAVAGVGCGGGSETPDAAVVPEPLWWQPKLGEVKDWDIQLNMPFDLSAPRKMYVLDLWEAVPLTMLLEYGGGETVSVPPGKLAGRITELHARTPPAIVICYVQTGILEKGRPDEPKFMALPDTTRGNEVPPNLAGTPSGVFLNTSAASRAAWAPLMFKRFDLARQIGCDGIAPAHNDVSTYTNTGLTIESTDTSSWYTEIATQGHQRMLSTGMLGGEGLSSLYDDLAATFDWLLVERCAEFDTCDAARPFINLEKPVLAVEYTTSSDDPPVEQNDVICLKQGGFITEGLLKDLPLSGAVRTPCEP